MKRMVIKMSITRKVIRNAMREEARKRKYDKPNRFVHKAFERFQEDRYGVHTRRRNAAKGTHTKRVWKSRIEANINQ